MPIDEDKIIPEITFPPIPSVDNIDPELRTYLSELENMLRRALRGSLFMEKTLQDGILGN